MTIFRIAHINQRWLPVSATGTLGGRAREHAGGLESVAEWIEIEAPKFSIAATLASQGQGEKRTVANAGPDRRPEHLRSGPPAPPDDSKLPVIYGMPYAEGWRTRYAGISPAPLFVAPDGTLYEYAPANAKADLIIDLSARELGRQRLRIARGQNAQAFQRAQTERASKPTTTPTTEEN